MKKKEENERHGYTKRERGVRKTKKGKSLSDKRCSLGLYSVWLLCCCRFQELVSGKGPDDATLPVTQTPNEASLLLLPAPSLGNLPLLSLLFFSLALWTNRRGSDSRLNRARRSRSQTSKIEPLLDTPVGPQMCANGCFLDLPFPFHFYLPPRLTLFR